MSDVVDAGFQVPEHVRKYLRDAGYTLPLDPMDEHVLNWDNWMASRGDFYDYRDTDGFGRVYEVHRRSLHPAARVCNEWASLLLNDKTSIVCEDQKCTDWISDFLSCTGFMAQAQATVVKAFGLGTGAWAVWLDLDKREVQVRRYDARMVIPLTWDETGVSECAFVTRAFHKGKAIDQLQMHVRELPEDDGGNTYATVHSIASHFATNENNHADHGADKLAARDGMEQSDSLATTYKIITVCFDAQGNVIEPAGICGFLDTGCTEPTFAIVKPAIDNTRVDMSPYGQSVFADAVDAIQAVDLAFDALINEVDVSKMRIFLSDVMFDRESDGKKSISIPFGKSDCTVFRKVMSADDMVQEFAPALRTDAQVAAFRIALQMLGDLCGFGISYFDFDNSGYVKTATEVSSDNSALMRNIRRHEHALEASLCQILRAVMECSRQLGVILPEPGRMSVTFDDSIITDTAAEKTQDMAEVGVTMQPWEYRSKWYGEDETTAKRALKGMAKRPLLEASPKA